MGLLKRAIFIILIFGPWGVKAAVLVEESGRPVSRSAVKAAVDTENFKQLRKVGLGMTVAGALGVIGTQLDINFTRDTSFAAGVGLGTGYQSFSFQLKRTIGGKWFAPYFSAGFARWYTARPSPGLEETNPPFLAEQFLTSEEKASGRFGINMLYPSLGLQYNQLQGSWSGISVFAEVIMLVEMRALVSAPTGGLGLMYYF